MRAIPVLLLLGACVGSAADGMPDAMRRYEEAAQFLAPGYESYAFAVEGEFDFTSEAESYLYVVVARSGSDFQKPKGLGAGRCRGVEVRDYGTQQVPKPWRTAGAPTAHIDGVPVWLDKGDGVNFDREEPLWTAVVDSRFHVRSHDRDQLEAALLRAGSLDAIVAPFAPVAFVPPDALRVICLRPRRADGSDGNRPVPIEPMVVALCPEMRLLLFHRLPLPAGFGVHAKQTVASRAIEGWTVDEIVFEEKAPAWSRLWFAQVFGLSFFL